MSSTFNVTGLVSDTDWQSLVTSINTAQKTAAEAPIKDQLTSQENTLSAWQSFNTSLSAVESNPRSMTSPVYDIVIGCCAKRD